MKEGNAIKADYFKNNRLGKSIVWKRSQKTIQYRLTFSEFFFNRKQNYYFGLLPVLLKITASRIVIIGCIDSFHKVWVNGLTN
jgi:hypothetical protein